MACPKKRKLLLENHLGGFKGGFPADFAELDRPTSSLPGPRTQRLHLLQLRVVQRGLQLPRAGLVEEVLGSEFANASNLVAADPPANSLTVGKCSGKPLDFNQKVEV